MKHVILLIIILLKLALPLQAVDFTMNNSDNTVNCGIANNFFDSGGSGGNYDDNESLVITFRPSVAGQFINLNFTNFNLNTGDVLTFFDGNNTTDPLIGTYSLNASPGTITATNTDGAITIRFTSNGSGNGAGWAANILCSATKTFPNVAVMTDGATFTSCNATFFDEGGQNGNYRDNQNQTMTFLPSNPGEFIQLNFTNFNLNTGDALSFYNGTSTTASLIGTYSLNASPGIIAASNVEGAITVRFTSNGSSISSGWQANISCNAAPAFPNTAVMTDGVSFVSCGAVFYDQGGPNNNYDNNENQTMTFLPSNPGEFIQIAFTNFLLNSGDEISFYNGNSVLSPLIGTYTLNTSPGTIAANNVEGAITVRFTSNGSSNNSGWQANVSCIPNPGFSNIAVMTDGVDFRACNAVFTDQGGASNNYRNNQNQTMTFYPENPGEFVQLNFTNFSLGSGDVVSFYDGTSTLATLIGSFELNASPGTIAASNVEGAITVRFTSDGSSNNSGWQANVSCLANPGSSTVAVMTHGAVFASCNASFFDQGGPNNNYKNNQNQTMQFFPEHPGEFVSLTFTNFNLQQNDFLTFYNGSSTSDPLIGAYNWNASPGTVTASNSDGALTVVFTSNGSGISSGWQANVSCLTTPGFPNTAVMTQGAVFTSCSGTFFDQGGPNNNYQNNQNQTMNFFPENLGQAVQLQFTNFNLNSGDQLSFYDGSTTLDPLIGSFTNSSPGTIDATNSDGALTVVFTSNGNGNNSGWQANIACTGTPLPIRLLDFQVKEQNSQAFITWSTASEINNDFFVIEKSRDIVKWTVLGRIEGAGNSSQVLHYSVVDVDPYPGISYYRLRQVDFDGKDSYSSIKVLNLSKEGTTELRIYPNPVQSYVFIQGNERQLKAIKIYNSLGQDISSSLTISPNGQGLLGIDMGHLSKGIYILQTTTGYHKIYKN